MINQGGVNITPLFYREEKGKNVENMVICRLKMPRPY